MKKCSKFSVNTYITTTIALNTFARTHTELEIITIFDEIKQKISEDCPDHLEVVNEYEKHALQIRNLINKI